MNLIAKHLSLTQKLNTYLINAFVGVLPQDDPAAYDASSMILSPNSTLLDAFSTVNLMLAHGLSDDNVHFRNCLYFLKP